VYWIRRLLFKIGYSQYGPTLVLENNQTCITFTKEKNNYWRVKHIDVKYHFTRELISNEYIWVKYLETEEQYMNIFTKIVTQAKHYDFYKKLGMDFGQLDESTSHQIEN
jgi:hypothetical protein